MLDIDAHHGNGTAGDLRRRRRRVCTGSVHVDPGAGWFPHFVGFAEDGRRGNRNVTARRPAPATTSGWPRCASSPSGRRRRAALVVALGVDAAGGDPEAPLAVTADGFRAAGRALGALGLPTVVVQEGGYDLETIGVLVRATLEGIEEG